MRFFAFTTSITRLPSPTVRVMGFSHQMSLPAFAAITLMQPCQCGGVQMWAMSTSLSASSSMKFLYALTLPQPFFSAWNRPACTRAS